jgi:hypothetical protein
MLRFSKYVDFGSACRKESMIKVTPLKTFFIAISGLLTSIGKTSREALISKEPTKFVVKISVNSRCNRVYQK